MKVYVVVFLLAIFLFNEVFAQESQMLPNICDASKNCRKACDHKMKPDHDDNDPAYRKLLLLCGEDVVGDLNKIIKP